MANERDDDPYADRFDDRYERRDDDRFERRDRSADYEDRAWSGLPPPNYLAFAIITTMLCCWPFGIPAIVYAVQVNSKWMVGDYAGARASSANAKMWCWISFFLGLLPMGAIFLYAFVLAATGK